MKILKQIFEILFVSIKTEDAGKFMEVYYKRERRKNFFALLEKPGEIERSSMQTAQPVFF